MYLGIFSYLCGVKLMNITMKTKLLVLVLCTFATLSCESIRPQGDIISLSRHYSTNVNSIDIPGHFTLNLDHSVPDGQIVITTNENIHQYVILEQSGDNISLKLDKNGKSYNNKVEITLSVAPRLFKHYSVSGGSEINGRNAGIENDVVSIDISGGSTVCGTIAAGRLRTSISGKSKMSCTLSLGQFEIEMSGGSRVDATGTVDKCSIDDCSGGSQMIAYGLACRELDADVSGGSRVEITVNEALTGDISGGSWINYKGSPSIVNVESRGGSKINKI